MELKNKKISFLGDSITEGVGADKPENNYVSVFGQLSGATVLNYGISATRIARQITPYDAVADKNDFIKRADDIDETSDIVVVFGGTNDFDHGDAPIGTFDDRDIYTFYGAMHTLCQKLIVKFPGKPIIFMTPLHRRNELDTNNDRNGQAKGPLKRYVEIIREVTEYYSLPVIDLYKNSCMQPVIEVIQNEFMPDRLHPSSKGHRLIAERIYSFLKTL